MKLTFVICLLAGVTHASIQGLDVSHYQQYVNFTEAYSMGLKFTYIKATEGTSYADPKFADHEKAARDAGFIRGGYHVASPSSSSGFDQARYFVAHGGGWTNDGKSLPGLLQLGGNCPDRNTSVTVDWIKQFADQYYGVTGRHIVIYTTNNWWVWCTGNSPAFKDSNPLMLAHWSDANAPGTVPGGWLYYTFWQYNDESAWGGNSDVFSGNSTLLEQFAKG